MEGPAAGEVVILPFPFADQTAHKLRPALVVSSWRFGAGHDCLVAMITSRPSKDVPTVVLAASDFVRGGLPQLSYVRPWYLLAPAASLIQGVQGRVTPAKFSEVCRLMRDLIPEGI